MTYETQVGYLCLFIGVCLFALRDQERKLAKGAASIADSLHFRCNKIIQKSSMVSL